MTSARRGIEERSALCVSRLPVRAAWCRQLARSVALGSDIWIHGMPDGCISVGNIAIEETWNAVDHGTPIGIRP